MKKLTLSKIGRIKMKAYKIKQKMEFILRIYPFNMKVPNPLLY